jgi:hypothetical protein
MIYRSAFETCTISVALLVAITGCGDSRSGARGRSDVPATGGASTGGTGGQGDAGASGEAGAAPAPDPNDDPVVTPYPRTAADSALTQRIVEGEVSLVGAGLTTCTNELPTPGDRWCAFSRAGQAGATELWVLNVSHALAEGPVTCDGTSAACLRLTSQLWTGFQVWGPGHPYSQRFDGDTLIFHADAAADVREPYEGPVYAWRPGWDAARRISSERGVVCAGHRRSPAVYCVDALDVDVEPNGQFSAPFWHSFDLLAGTLDGTDGTEDPLRLVERIAFPTGDAQAFRARFTRLGDKLAYSSVLSGDSRQTLRWVSLVDSGPFVTKTVLADAAQWELTHDGAAVYVLRGHGRETPLGELALADFPSGENVQAIASDVDHVDLVGDADDSLTDEDRGAGYARWTPDGEAFHFIKDRTKPAATQRLASNAEGHLLAADGVHTLLFQGLRPGDYPVAQIARNDGSGACTLNREISAETYAGRFSEDGTRAFWIEFGSSGSEEGWSADPTTCERQVKFGDWVLGYMLSGDFVVFEGGDEADSTSYIQYARWSTAGNTLTPLVVAEHPRHPFLTLREGDATYIVYALVGDAPESQGLFVHGPLP